jgi:hypothetical protein
MAHEIEQEILRQLGGNKFIAMTGAKNFVAGDGILAFRIPKALDGINAIRITLTSLDLYDLKFFRIYGADMTLVAEVNGVYNDQLQSIFTAKTGLYTHL